jgi:hypothetical protein
LVQARRKQGGHPSVMHALCRFSRRILKSAGAVHDRINVFEQWDEISWSRACEIQPYVSHVP